jgi:hypothetical protein
MSAWIDQIFNSQIARRGGVVRRKISSVRKYASAWPDSRAERRCL